MIVFSVTAVVSVTPAVAVGTGAYGAWWWFYSPHKEEA